MYQDTAAADCRIPAAVDAAGGRVVEAVADAVDGGRTRNGGIRIRRRTIRARVHPVPPLSAASAQLRHDGAEVAVLPPQPTIAIWLATTPSPYRRWKDARNSRT